MDMNPLPHPDNPVPPPPLPENPVDIPQPPPPYAPPEITTYVPPVAVIPIDNRVYESVPDDTPDPYTPVVPSGLENSILLAGVAATVIGASNHLYPNVTNNYQPGPGTAPDPLPVYENPVAPEPLPVYEQIFNFPVEVPTPPPIFESPVVVTDSWSKGEDIRVYSQPVYVFGPEPSNGQTTVSDLMGTSTDDGWTGPLPFF